MSSLPFALTTVQQIKNYQQLAGALGIAPKQMLVDLYKRGSGYKISLIEKSDGSFRRIESPHATHRHIQRQLKGLLDQVYRPVEPVHGFRTGRSVATNAEQHLARRTIVRVDLKDFFRTITFGRVRGVFLKPPFRFEWSVATILAHACCCQGVLATGGLTSPVLSNLICSKMDKELLRLASKFNGRYTRYSDDMHFSFNRRPEAIPQFIAIDSDGNQTIGPGLAGVLAANYFVSNDEKFRVMSFGRKKVTGVLVNERLNLHRRWIRALDSKIYAIEKFGVARVSQSMYSGKPQDVAAAMTRRHLQGRVAYLAMIRGRNDWISAGFANRLNRVFGYSQPRMNLPDVEIVSRSERRELGIWVVTSHASTAGDLHVVYEEQGTGFTGDKGLIFTARHVVCNKAGQLFPYIFVRRAANPTHLIPCRVVASEVASDIAILRLISPDHDQTRVRFRFNGRPEIADKAESYGYPGYFPGQKITRRVHDVITTRVVGGIFRVLLNDVIAGGMSGGPVFDNSGAVVGIITRGVAAEGGHLVTNEAVGIEQAMKLMAHAAP